jgi:hypothetical protein
MKKFVLILSAILLISLLVVSFAQEKYEPVSVKEKELLNQGYKVDDFKDELYDQRIIYFTSKPWTGKFDLMQTYKRVVTFKKMSYKTQTLGKDYGEWNMKIESAETITLTLFYVVRKTTVTWTEEKKAEKEVKIPVSLETETKVDIQKFEKKIPIGRETK